MPYRMTQAMRWFGPSDPVGLPAIRQAGASEIVSALHEIANGAEWPLAAIVQRKALAAAAGLGWSVVESLPVSEAIKCGGAAWDEHVDRYLRSLANLAACGMTTITYNFMPLLDWTRTDLAHAMPDGARALRFELEAIAVYDIHILRRTGAAGDYPEAMVEAAARRFRPMSDAQRGTLERAIIAGLPGSEESFSSAQFLTALDSYAAIDADQLRVNHARFLDAVCPRADELGLRMVVHPDDPPFPLFGLPRVVSTQADLDALFARVPNRSNGLCLCTGSLGARGDNDVPAMIDRFGERIGFLHLRNVRRTGTGTFHEAAHLDGDVDMVAAMRAIRRVSLRERRSIPMRPDHGHQMLDDLKKTTNPGYSAIGRLRGLAELRGLEMGMAAFDDMLVTTPTVKSNDTVSCPVTSTMLA